MMRRSKGDYPHDWANLAKQVKDEANWRCVRCDHPHSPKTGYCLTVHHLDMNPSNNRWWNLAALCQRCHLSIQGRVVLERPWMFEHSEWFKPYAAGWYAWRYLGVDLELSDVEDRLEELLELEPRVLRGERVS